jgi:methenyltetrahydrofolate cyclohydrolase
MPAAHQPKEKAMRQSTITAFLDSLADRTPAPGGGATAALHLGQAAALVSMVARYSTGPRYAEHAAVIDGICSAADAIREQALHFAEADMAAFSSVIDAYRLPKSTESEAAERDRVIGAALTDAARIPADVLASARAVIELADELLPVANRTVISDVAAAAEAARAAATTARVNVEVNLPGIPQSDARFAFIDAVTSVDATVSHADRITTQVRKQLNS